MPLLAVKCPVDHVARIGERGRELAVEIGIILNDEETQGEVPPLSPPAGGTMTARIALCQQVCHYIMIVESLRKGATGSPKSLAMMARGMLSIPTISGASGRE